MKFCAAYMILCWTVLASPCQPWQLVYYTPMSDNFSRIFNALGTHPLGQHIGKSATTGMCCQVHVHF